MTAQQHIKTKFGRRYTTIDYDRDDYGGGGVCCYPNYNHAYGYDEEHEVTLALAPPKTAVQSELFEPSTNSRLGKIAAETKDKWLKREGEIHIGMGNEQEIYFSHDFYWREYKPKDKLCIIYPYPDIDHATICNFRKGDIISGNEKNEYVVLDINDLEGGYIEVKSIAGPSEGNRWASDFEDFRKIIE